MTEILDSYLYFCIGRIYYIVPVAEVEKISLLEEAIPDEELRFVKLGNTDGSKEQDPGAGRRSCVVILKTGSGRYAVRVSQAEGIVEIRPQDQYELPALLQGAYPWLLGAAVVKDRLFLLLNSQKLWLLTDGEKDGD